MMNCCADTKLGLFNPIIRHAAMSKQDGWTPLLHAADGARTAVTVEMIKCLVEHGADVNAVDWVCS